MNDSDTHEAEWRGKLHTETAYWRSIISGANPRKEWVALFKKRASGLYPWPENLTKFINQQGETKILDVGSGPHTTIGPIGAPGMISITAVDPLADDYNSLLREFNITPHIKTIKGDAEKIRDYVEGSFDLVYSRNALDHSYDPIAAIRSMLACTNESGVVYLEGAVNEGINQNYHGLHQWNFMPLKNGDFVIWNKIEATSIRSSLGDSYYVDARRDNNWYKILIKGAL